MPSTPLGSVRASEPPPDGVVLKWMVERGAAEGCAQPEEIAARVDTILERRAFEPEATAAPWAPVLHVRVLRDAPSPRLRAIVTLEPATLDESPSASEPTTGGSTREIVAPTSDCRSLDEPLALVIALMIDVELASEPEHVHVPARKDPTSERPAPDEGDGAAPILTAPSLQRDVPPRWGFDAGVAALLAAGILPGAAFGAEVAAWVAPPAPVGLRVHGAAFLPTEEPVESTASASFRLAYGGADACTTIEASARWRFRPCAGASFGWMSVRPRGLEEARGVARFAAQGEAGLLTAHRLGGGWLATASAFALLPIDPVRFVFTRADGRSEPVFRQAPIAFVLGVGAAFGVE